jgi:hypothetical protein
MLTSCNLSLEDYAGGSGGAREKILQVKIHGVLKFLSIIISVLNGEVKRT